MDGFSVFKHSWSARYHHFQTASPTSSGAPTGDDGDDGRGWEELGGIETAGMSAISGEDKQQAVCGCTLYMI